MAVGRSMTLKSLRHVDVDTAAAARWQSLPKHLQQQVDMLLLNQIGARPGVSPGWQSAVYVSRDASFAAVDVLAPGPLPPATEVDVLARVEGLSVILDVRRKVTAAGRSGRGVNGGSKSGAIHKGGGSGGSGKGGNGGGGEGNATVGDGGGGAGFVVSLPEKIAEVVKSVKLVGTKVNRRTGLLTVRVFLEAR